MSEAIFPFERPYREVEERIDEFAQAVIGTLKSSFTTIPIGSGFVSYAVFESGYESLRRATKNFARVTPEAVSKAVSDQPMALVALRTILGFTPGEWAHLAAERSKTRVSEGYARSLDKRIRTKPASPLEVNDRIQVMIEEACWLLGTGPPVLEPGTLHRLDKADTREGSASLQAVSKLGVPYAMLLYERLLGRPFATLRDASSEKKGDIMEVRVEEQLAKAGIVYRKTRHAERLAGFEQAPDFVIPDEFNPSIVIEAKITEDAGTARDKATRIQHLHTLSANRVEDGLPKFEVIACIDGRGFATRREDMKKIIRATEGRVFTLRTLDRMVDHTELSGFRTP